MSPRAGPMTESSDVKGSAVTSGAASLPGISADGYTPTTGVVGCGKVGTALARVLARHGDRVLLHNRTRSTAAELAEAIGATVADTPRQLAEQCDVVYTCLTGWNAVESAYLGPHGLFGAPAPLDAGRGRASFVDLGTLDLAQARQLAERAAAAGHRFVHAAVSGRPVDLERGAGFVIASGDAGALDAAAPVLRALGSLHFVGSEPAGAAVVKLAINVMVFSALINAAEALNLAESAGLDRSTVFDLLMESPAGSALLEMRRQAFLQPDEVIVQATVDLAVKNLGLITGLARETHTLLPQTDAVVKIFRAASAAGFGDRDATAIAEYLRTLHPAADSPT